MSNGGLALRNGGRWREIGDQLLKEEEHSPTFFTTQLVMVWNGRPGQDDIGENIHLRNCYVVSPVPGVLFYFFSCYQCPAAVDSPHHFYTSKIVLVQKGVPSDAEMRDDHVPAISLKRYPVPPEPKAKAFQLSPRNNFLPSPASNREESVGVIRRYQHFCLLIGRNFLKLDVIFVFLL